MPHPYFADAMYPRVFAHRGLVTDALAADGVVENSGAAFDAAIAAGAEYIETDCHVTSDGTVVLAHDADLGRLLGDPRPISAIAYDELCAMTADRGGLLTLEQALEEFPGTRFNIDVKADEAAEAVGRIVAPHADRVLLTAFANRRRRLAVSATKAVGGRAPATSSDARVLARLIALLSVRASSAAKRALAGVDALQIPERYRGVRVLSGRLIEAAHRAGVEVHVWTVNDPHEMLRFVGMGVDGVITDRADLALETLRPRSRG